MPPEPLGHETCDTLANGSLELIQSRFGFRVTLDPLLLSAFVALKGRERVVDLGTGCGVIPLLLSRRYPEASFLGVEIDREAAALAGRNVALNGMTDTVEIVPGDVRTLRPKELHQSFDVAVSNPPYRSPSSGRVAPQPGRAGARHELNGDVGDFLAVARFLLKNRGRLYLIYLPERLAALLTAMTECSIEPKRLRFVHSRRGERACLVLVEGRRAGKNGGVQVEPPLVIYRDDGRYSAEVEEIMAWGS